jgi:hypothetical protein
MAKRKALGKRVPRPETEIKTNPESETLAPRVQAGFNAALVHWVTSRVEACAL